MLSAKSPKTLFQPRKTRSTVKIETAKSCKKGGATKMSKPYPPTHPETNTAAEKEQSPLKGTLASVLLLGLIIVAVWCGVFALYMSRL
jgi:hypothetical protein